MLPLGPIELLILALAAYRITRLVTEDTIIARPRAALMSWLDAHRLSSVSELLGCFWCTGVWVAAAIYFTWLVAVGEWSDSPLLTHAITVAAIAGGQGLLGSWEGQ